MPKYSTIQQLNLIQTEILQRKDVNAALALMAENKNITFEQIIERLKLNYTKQHLSRLLKKYGGEQ